MGRRVKLGLGSAAVAALLFASHAGAAGLPQGYVPWPNVLPGRTVGPSGPPHSVPGCRSLQLSCVDRLLVRMRGKWREEDRACDHRAIFTIGYLRITREIRRRLAHHETFEYRPWFISVVQGFSDEYFATQRRYDAGKPIPQSWQIYYDAMGTGDYNAGQDLLLASNAHTNHDLPYAYAASGLLTRKGVSRKHDHDAVNDVNATVYQGIANYYAEHYDPLFSSFNATSPVPQLTIAQMIVAWRENAWREAERLVAAKTKSDLRQVEQQIEATSTATAQLITSGAEPGYRQTRDAFCEAHHVTG
jgi:hypothetical protein